MARERAIFRRMRLTPGQAREVGRRRLEDARYLVASGLTKHANGAMYLGGYAVECMLKASLLERYPVLQVSARSGNDRLDRLRSLVYKSHELDLLLAEVPDLIPQIESRLQRSAPRVVAGLRSICAEWNVSARYSSKQASITDAIEFMNTIEEVVPWLQ